MRQRIKESLADFCRLFVEALLRTLASDLAAAIVSLIKNFF